MAVKVDYSTIPRSYRWIPLRRVRLYQEPHARPAMGPPLTWVSRTFGTNSSMRG
jgi:hypothetical protein